MEPESQTAEPHVREQQQVNLQNHQRASSHLLDAAGHLEKSLREQMDYQKPRASASAAEPHDTPFYMREMSNQSIDQESGIDEEQAGALNLEQVSLSSRRSNFLTPCDEPKESNDLDIEKLKKNMTPEELKYVEYLIDNNKLDKVNGPREISPRSPNSRQEQKEEALSAESDDPLTEMDEEAGSDANDSKQLGRDSKPQSIDTQLKHCWVAALPQIASLTLSKLTVFGGAFFVSWAGYHKIETPEATTAAIKGIGLGSMILSLICCEICFGINATLETMVSQAYGASRNQHENSGYRAEMREACGRYLNMARVTTTVFLMVPTACLFFFADDLLVHFFHQDALVSGLAIQYCIMSMPAVWAISQFDATRRFLAAQSIGSLPLAVQMGSMLVHLVCSYMFIVKLEWGTLGVAISLNASCILSTLLLDLLVSMECEKEGDRFQSMWLSWAKCSYEDFGTFLSTSVCNVLIRCSHQWSLQVLLFACGVNYLGSGRTNDQLTRTFNAEFILLNVLTWLIVLPEGLQIAVTALVGQNIARRSLVKDAIRYSKVGYTLFVLFMVITCLVVNFFGLKLVARLESNLIVVNDIQKVIPLFLAMFILLSSFIMLVGFLRGLKKLKFAAFMSMLMFVGVGVPLAAILGENTKQRAQLNKLLSMFQLNDQQIGLFGFNFGYCGALALLNIALAVYIGLVVDWTAQSKRIAARFSQMAEVARVNKNIIKQESQQARHQHVPTSDLSLNEESNHSEYAAIIQQPESESNASPLTDRYEFNTCIESSYDSINMGEQPQWTSGLIGPVANCNMDQLGAHLSHSYQYISADLRQSDAGNLTLDQQHFIDQAQLGSNSDIMLSSQDKIEVNNILNNLRQGLGRASEGRSSLDLSPMASSQQRIMTLQEQREWYLSQLRAIDDAQRHERLMQSQRMQAQF